MLSGVQNCSRPAGEKRWIAPTKKNLGHPAGVGFGGALPSCNEDPPLKPSLSLSESLEIGTGPDGSVRLNRDPGHFKGLMKCLDSLL